MSDFPYYFHMTPVGEPSPIEVFYAIEPPDPDVGIKGGAIDRWMCFDVYGRQLFPYHFSALAVKDITTAILADYADRVEANQEDIAAHAAATKDL